MAKLTERKPNLERELGYRRGYVHGVNVTISAIVDYLSEAQRLELETWAVNELAPWSNTSVKKLPNFPELKQAEPRLVPYDASERLEPMPSTGFIPLTISKNPGP
jgi:hypothetical protein